MQPSGFDRLAQPIQRWIWQKKWQRLRDVQEKAIPAVLSGGDVVISARTAAGKTEAAILPLLTRVLAKQNRDGFAILYVSPLKALLNDQHRRLESLCDACDVGLHKWHGDVSADAKARARKSPSGIVLITPESLEALLVRRGREIRFLFSALEAVVIDELHAFIGTERGMQLQSILNRIEIECGRERIDRVGLSATLGDMGLAAEAMRPGEGASVTLVHGNDEGNGLKLQIRGYIEDEPSPDVDGEGQETEPGETESHGIPPRVAYDLSRFLRGSRNLLFAGSRQRVELYADRLRTMCEESNLPNEFFPHHGSLSRSEREDLEIRLRDDPRPTTAVATTTLELGIDIGDVESVAQIGPGFTVSSLRQRLGRSGRRAGNPAIMRLFVIEREPGRGQHPVDRLNLGLIQSIAMIECLKEGWCEPPEPSGFHLSTLLHQILALILQKTGIRPHIAYRILCERGPFRSVGKGLFADLLRCMASPENQLIEQSPDGLLMIGGNGEKITESHEFYPVFATEREYRVMHEARILGNYPLDSAIKNGETLIFAGRRWLVLSVDDATRVISVRPNRGGKPPRFSGNGGNIHDHIAEKMRQVLSSDEEYPYIDRVAGELLVGARETFRKLQLEKQSVIPYGDGVIVFPWVGTKKLNTLALAFLSREFKTAPFAFVIELQECNVDGVDCYLKAFAQGDLPSTEALMEGISKPNIAKFDGFLSWELMTLVTLRERLDIEALPGVALRVTRE
ncbi:DEAD/DEAH box helicase [Shinella sp. CPCC 101442]|uniref:DEAD/DEAH box helicase n=1 Tax=Shinella sp. CPCC 101442 TaxID=2932265 RepID=UPI0021528D41|nr:DEAD/DEAH box helicase [Shinella sp. CPCC 101442]MCR6501326.1 DEAD/DEAH box helicase [Shinella sp. CPCC 101442]